MPSSARWREYGIPALLLASSVVTTTAIGARFMRNFLDGLPAIAQDSDLWPWPWLFEHPSRFLLGWPFSLTLLVILLTHEFGHYLACRVHGIRCTLPWVLPAPTLSGTAGAVIRIRGRIPNRRALMDVGVYGPLAGYLVSLLAVAAGFLLSRPAPLASSSSPVPFGGSFTLELVHTALAVLHRPAAPAFYAASHHPVLIAGWIGLFITSLNLIPTGQLDGGHILYAISPRIHAVVSRIFPFLLLAAGLFFWIGWILWAILLFLPAMRHPAVPIDRPLGLHRAFLGGIALVIFVLTSSAAPIAGSSLLHYLRR